MLGKIHGNAFLSLQCRAPTRKKQKAISKQKPAHPLSLLSRPLDSRYPDSFLLARVPSPSTAAGQATAASRAHVVFSLRVPPMSSHAHAGHCRRLFLLRRTSTSTKLLYLLVLLVAVVLIVDVCTASREFSTVAISHAPNATLVCALVTSSAADDAGGAGSPGSKLHCTSHPDGQQFVYPSADIPYNAIAAGTDFLCGLMAPLGGHAAMRWWSFSEEFAANRSRPVGRRLYWGPSLRSLNAGGSHVCGLSDDHDPTCWEWPHLDLRKGLDFSRIALGHDFLCGIDKRDNTSMSCFGGMTAPSLTPTPAAFKNVATGHRHACAVDVEGGFACWGVGTVPEVPTHKLSGNMLTMALGSDATCNLSGSGRVQCWTVGAPGAGLVKEHGFHGHRG